VVEGGGGGCGLMLGGRWELFISCRVGAHPKLRVKQCCARTWTGCGGGIRFRFLVEGYVWG